MKQSSSACLAGAVCRRAQASVGLAELPGTQGRWPGHSCSTRPAAGRPAIAARALRARTSTGRASRCAATRRLVVISHGSGGAPWVHADLARRAGRSRLRRRDARTPRRQLQDPIPARPRELEAASGRSLARHRRGGPGPALRAAAVARQGGHVRHVGRRPHRADAGRRALVAGGLFARHCEAHIAEDFPACVGPDHPPERQLARRCQESRWRWPSSATASTTPPGTRYDDPRIQAIVADVPFAADFDPPRSPSRACRWAWSPRASDNWLAPRFHSGPVLQACTPCEQSSPTCRPPVTARCSRRHRRWPTWARSPPTCWATRPASTAPDARSGSQDRRVPARPPAPLESNAHAHRPFRPKRSNASPASGPAPSWAGTSTPALYVLVNLFIFAISRYGFGHPALVGLIRCWAGAWGWRCTASRCSCSARAAVLRERLVQKERERLQREQRRF